MILDFGIPEFDIGIGNPTHEPVRNETQENEILMTQISKLTYVFECFLKIDIQSYQHFEKQEEEDVEACLSGSRQ